jgi:hypothetical protein
VREIFYGLTSPLIVNQRMLLKSVIPANAGISS